MKIKKNTFAAFLLTFPLLLQAQEGSYLNGAVERISDGDTIVVRERGVETRVRLFGIDAPEVSQPFGAQSKEHLTRLIGDGPVTVFVRAGDRYGRLVGEVYHDGIAINREMVRSGHAWWYKAYSSDDQDLSRLEIDARRRRIGLWEDDDPIAPWRYRRNQSRERLAATFPDIQLHVDETTYQAGVDEIPEELYPDVTGYDLIDLLKRQFRPDFLHGYRDARQYMFCRSDNENGVITLAYTGAAFECESDALCGIPDHEHVNTEHIWPQSKFGRDRAIKSDIHLLAPVYSRVNSSRSNKPFAEIDDDQTEAWWGSDASLAEKPEHGFARFSESTTSFFEPRESFKGDVAQAMFYVFTVYHDANLSFDWFEPQIETLLEWNVLDPPDRRELNRTKSIALTQGNKNPFVIDPSLAERIFGALD